MSDMSNPPDFVRTDGEPPEPGRAAGERFEACRWRAAPDADEAAYCTHRDVLPYAGTTGFNPRAWCPDCAFFKARRAARKQPDALADDYH